MTYNSIHTTYEIALDQAQDNAAYAHRAHIERTLSQYRLHNHRLHIRDQELWIDDNVWYANLPGADHPLLRELRNLAHEIENAPWAKRMNGMPIIT